MNSGDLIWVKAHKADGTCYRSCQATTVTVDDQHVVMFVPRNTEVHDIDKGLMHTPRNYQATYRFDKPYTFIEIFDETGALVELYMDICSPPQIVEGELHYIDYELDVARVMPEAAFVMDEDEFAEAVVKYGYSTALQNRCYRAVKEALAVANAYAVTLPTSHATAPQTR